MDPKDEIKQKIDIAELIGEYLTLKPSGSHGFKGLCPFHGEKTPSFHVSADKQIWHCFGCSEGGDCFSFVMKMEGMDFPEALMHLGKRVGVEVKRYSSADQNVRGRMLSINELAAKYFQKVLLDSPKAKHARDYVTKRNISDEISQRFQLGCAPDSWDALSLFLIKKGYSESEIVTSGLALRKKSGSGIIDRFRNRLMVPLCDHHGNVVGFTGRVLSEKDKPKYMNSPETPVYHKGSLVFGLHLAKRSAKEKGSIVVVEGNLDVIASHKTQVQNIVASSGTALTEDQLTLLKRYTNSILFALDSDAAGFEAAKKGIRLAKQLDLDVRAIILPNDVKDPDDVIQKGPSIWEQCVNESVPIMEYLISHVTTGKDFTNVDDKRAIAAELLPFLQDIKNVVEREHWLQVVGDLLRVESSVLRQSLSPKTKTPVKTKQISREGATKSRKISKYEQAVLMLLGACFLDSTDEKFILGQLDQFDLPTKDLSELYKLMEEEYNSPVKSAQKSYFKRLEERIAGQSESESMLSLLNKSCIFAEKSFLKMSQQQVLKQLQILIKILQSQNERARKKELATKIRQAELAGDKDLVEKLLKEFNQS